MVDTSDLTIQQVVKTIVDKIEAFPLTLGV